MPNDYNPVSTDHSSTTFEKLVDGDPLNANNNEHETSPGAKPNLTKAALADWLAFVAAEAASAATAAAAFGSGTQNRVSDGFVRYPTASSSWQYAGGFNCYTTTGVTAADKLVYELDSMALPHGRTLNSVTLRIRGAPSHGGSWPPASMPTLAIYAIDAFGNATQVGTTTTDASNQATYESTTPHALTVSSINVTADRTQYVFQAVFFPEDGMNALAGTRAFLPVVTWT